MQIQRVRERDRAKEKEKHTDTASPRYSQLANKTNIHKDKKTEGL